MRFRVSFGLVMDAELTRVGIWILVGQIGDIKRQKVRLEALKKEAEEERQRAREAARERVLLEFEKGQLGLAATSVISTSGQADPSEGKYPFFGLLRPSLPVTEDPEEVTQPGGRSASSTSTRARWRH